MARVLLAAIDGKRAVVWAEIDDVAGELVGLDVDNGSGKRVRVGEGADGKRAGREFGAGTRGLVTLPAAERVKLTYDRRRGRWDGLNLSIGWG